MKNSISTSQISSLKRSDCVILLIIGLLVALGVAALQRVPGYIDADYYFAVGKQLASGHGFTQPFLWNYLSQPQGLPYSSNSYWNPLAAIIAAGGMALTGKLSFSSARIGFILMTALSPVVIAILAQRITKRRSLALVAGFLAIFSGYYMPFIVTTDNYSIYMLVGGIFFLILDRFTLPKSFLLGLVAGILNLARADGLLWFPLTIVAALVPTLQNYQVSKLWKKILFSVASIVMVFAGYLLIMGGWYFRNLTVFGSAIPPGSGYVLWMTSYNQLFSFTPSIYSFQSWFASGLQAAIQVRLSALWQNLSTALFAEGMIFLVPLIVTGVWKNRKSWFVQVGVMGWLIMWLAESMLFPFASVRGGFFHAGTAFQPLWFVLAPIGLDMLLLRRPWKNRLVKDLSRMSPFILLGIMLLFSGMLVQLRVVETGWNEGEFLYQKVEQFLEKNGASVNSVVVVRNPPAYFIMTGRQAIVVPFGDVQMLLDAAEKYNARYVILENIKGAGPVYDLYEHPQNYPEFSTMGVLGDTHILAINSAQ